MGTNCERLFVIRFFYFAMERLREFLGGGGGGTFYIIEYGDVRSL